MSKEEIPWDRVAKEIVRILGLEVSKGMLYGFTINTLYPAIVERLRSMMVGGYVPSNEDIRKVIQEEIARTHGMKMSTLQQPVTAEDLERRVSELMRQMSQSQTYGPAPAYPPPPQRIPPDVEYEMEQIKNRLNTLENTRNQLLSKKYMTLDEAERKKIEDSIREIDGDIERDKNRLLNIRSMYRM